jgi:hypothetical protein
MGFMIHIAFSSKAHLDNWDDCIAYCSILAELVLCKQLQDTAEEGNTQHSNSYQHPKHSASSCSYAFAVSVSASMRYSIQPQQNGTAKHHRDCCMQQRQVHVLVGPLLQWSAACILSIPASSCCSGSAAVAVAHAVGTQPLLACCTENAAGAAAAALGM